MGWVGVIEKLAEESRVNRENRIRQWERIAGRPHAEITLGDHPDYKDKGRRAAKVGANKGDVFPEEICELLESKSRIAGLGISRTFQDPTTYPSMTALDILMAGRYLHTKANMLHSMIFFGRSKREELESRRLVEETITFTHIEDLRKLPLATMSYGQRKQVEMARALVMKPEVIILDEPMSGLDDAMKEIVTDLILDMHDRGMTIVLIEHDIQAVMELSHSIIVLDYGEVIAEGTPQEISQNQRVTEAYLGGWSSAKQ